MDLDSNDDLDWLAFRYISNEMTQAEADRFEQRLGEDQLAREAVARAVAWTEAVASVPHKGSPTPQAISMPRMRWFAVAAAGLAASVMVFHSVRNSLDLKTLARSFAEHMGPDTFRVADTELIADSDDSTSSEDDSDVSVPSWMIEAVVGSSDADKQGGI
jgi:ferric-dicitrate binding protein FerR (iron transport regulator)